MSAKASPGKRRASPPRDTTRAPSPGGQCARRHRGALVLLGTGITVATVVWGTLVFTAIDLGRSARDGESGLWVPMGFATLGAVAAILVAIVLVVRLVDAVRAPEQRPAVRARGGKRAAR